MNYGEFEEKLARLHEVVDEDRKAFRGRLRNLRDLGVPDKPAMGSGKRLAFGLPPLRIAMLVKYLRRYSPLETIRRHEENLWLMISIRSNVGKAQDVGEEIIALASFVPIESISAYFQLCANPPTHSNFDGFLNATQLVRDLA